MRLGTLTFLLATMCTPAPSAQRAPGPSVASTPPPRVAQRTPPASTSPPPSLAQPNAAPETSEEPDAATARTPTTVCDASPVRRQITQALFADQMFRGYVCDLLPCSEQTFAQGFLLRQELLSERPATWGCFAEPERQGTTGLFELFLVQNGTADWEMSYSGIYLGTKRGHQTHGYADLEGREREYPATWLTHRFIWNGKGYVLKSVEAATPD